MQVPLFYAYSNEYNLNQFSNFSSGYALIDIKLNNQIFNYCDFNNYNSNKIKDLLRAHNVSERKPWIAMYGNMPPVASCPDLTVEEAYIMAWSKLYVLFIQKLGASALILGILKLKYYIYIYIYIHV